MDVADKSLLLLDVMFLDKLMMINQSISQSFAYSSISAQYSHEAIQYERDNKTSATLIVAALKPNSTTRTRDTGYEHRLRTPQRTSSQKFYNKVATSQCQSPTSRHVKMLGCGKFLSVGGDFVVQQVVGVRSRCPCSGVWH